MKITNKRNNLHKIIDIDKYTDQQLRVIEYFYKNHPYYEVEI